MKRLSTPAINSLIAGVDLVAVFGQIVCEFLLCI